MESPLNLDLDYNKLTNTELISEEDRSPVENNTFVSNRKVKY